MSNRAAWLLEKGNIKVDTMPMPVPEADEVLIRVHFVGICGSDMHFFETGCYSKGPIPGPHIIGHECAGVVEAVGADVTNLQVGDRVTVEPGEGCGACALCKSGRYNLCPQVKFKSVPPYHGVLRDYITHKAALCFKLPQNVSTMEGAMIEPFAIGLYAAQKAGASPGKTAMILGAGCIGMMTLLACRALGVSTIIAADLYDSRLQKARTAGADIVINTAKEDCDVRVMQATDGYGADIVFETAGSEKTLLMAPKLCKSGGTIMMVGNVFQPVTFDFWDIAHREVTISSIYRYCNIFPLALEMLSQGKVDLKQVITGTYPLQDAQRAFESVSRDKEHTLKGIIQLV
nr:NAD(P)-dependent alcohol dehydrogenase [Maliibacterium massiliense]